MKKVLLVTDISLSKGYNAGNKNALISLCNFFNKNENYSVEVLNFHHKKPSDVLEFKVKHYPDYINLLLRKLYNILGKDKKLLDYKKSFLRKIVMSFFLYRREFDYVIIEYIENHHLINICKKNDIITLCDLHDVMSLRKKSFEDCGKIPSNENLYITLKDEIEIINKFDAVITIENTEYEFLKQNKITSDVILCKRALKVENIDVNKKIKLDAKAIGFIGSAAEFNFEAISFFIKNIWNRGLYLCDYDLIVAGSICDEIKTLSIKGSYKILGKIECVAEFYSAIHVSINPVFSGSGFKTKNAESLSYGVPIITTLNGIKGLEDINNKFFSIIEYSDSYEVWDSILNNIFINYENYDVKSLCSKNYHELNNDSVTFKEINDYLL